MSVSARQRATVRAVAGLELRDGRDHGWDEAQVLAAAANTPGGEKADQRTLESLRSHCLLARRRSDGRWVLTEAARVRLREGL